MEMELETEGNSEVELEMETEMERCPWGPGAEGGPCSFQDRSKLGLFPKHEFPPLHRRVPGQHVGGGHA